MKPPKAKVKKSRNRLWLKRILITLVAIILFPVSIFTVGWLNRNTVIDVLQEWYSSNNNGTLKIGKVNANFLSDFPKIGFTLKDIKHTNTDTITDIVSLVTIEEAILVIGANNLLRGNIQFEKISIKNALLLSKVNSKRSIKYHERLKLKKQNVERRGIQLPEWLNVKGADFLMEDVKYITKDTILNRYFNLDVHRIKGAFKGKDQKLSGSSSIDITVNDLAFNTEKGSFLNGARLSGSPNFMIDINNNKIEIPQFPLKIDEQIFTLNAVFDVSDSNNYVIELKNDLTDFEAVKGLLHNQLQSKLKNYKILNPVKSDVILSGEFSYGNNPDINADFSTEGNEIIIADRINLSNASFNGIITTDIYESDSLKWANKSPKDIKVYFNELTAENGDIKILLNNSFYQSTADALNFINANVILAGSNEALAKIIDTDNFDFEGGKFEFKTSIIGDIAKPNQFLNSAEGTFRLNNTRVTLRKNGLQLPIEAIKISLKRERSILDELRIILPNDENLILEGELRNISGLLSKNPSNPTTSNITLNSNNLNVNEVISMVTQFIPKSRTSIEDRRNLHETLEAVYNQFHPQFNIDLGSLEFNNVIIKDLKSEIELTNSETILLRNFKFAYFDSQTSLNGTVRVPNPKGDKKDPIFINAEASSSGSLKVFKELFNIELFRIDSGTYDFAGNVTGNVQRLSQILRSAKGDLTLNNTKLHYEPATIDIEIDSLNLLVADSNLLLQEFSLEIGELYPINLTGKIEQFPGFLLDNMPIEGATFFKINIPFIDSDKWLGTINSLKKDDKLDRPQVRKELHTIFKDINKFNPEIQLVIDSLKYNELISKTINARVFFENDSILKLDNFDLKYKETQVNIEGVVNAHLDQEDLLNNNPFDFKLLLKVKGKTKDLNDYLKTQNFVFKSGDFEFNGNYSGQSDALEIMNSNAFGDLKIGNTLVDFTTADLQIPVDSLHVEIDNNVATLKTLDIDLPNKSSLYFTGSIDNFSNFINNNQSITQHSSNFSISSPYLNTSDLKQFLNSSNKVIANKDKKDLDLKKLKQALAGINNSFYPTVSLSLDTLKHKNFSFTDFGLELLFDKEGKFKIEETQLNFHGGTAVLKAVVDINEDGNLPLKLEMQAENIDISEVVTRMDYFNDEDLRNAEKLEGNLNFKISASGNLNNDGKLNMDSVNGTIFIELEELAIFDYKPIMENVVLLKDERFKNLRFRPIVQTFKIENGKIVIPRTEIQSTAIQLFMEGSLKLGEYIDIWLALPWKNLKSNDGLTLPEKTSFENAGSKFYVQLLQDKTSEKEKKRKLKVKVKLGNRKLRKIREEFN